MRIDRVRVNNLLLFQGPELGSNISTDPSTCKEQSVHYEFTTKYFNRLHNCQTSNGAQNYSSSLLSPFDLNADAVDDTDIKGRL